MNYRRVHRKKKKKEGGRKGGDIHIAFPGQGWMTYTIKSLFSNIGSVRPDGRIFPLRQKSVSAVSSFGAE